MKRIHEAQEYEITRIARVYNRIFRMTFHSTTGWGGGCDYHRIVEWKQGQWCGDKFAVLLLKTSKKES